MTKSEFLDRLRDGLSGLPQSDVEERITFYSEMIDDRMEEGLSEEEALAAVGNVGDIVAQTIEDTPQSKLAKVKTAPKRRLKTWEIILLVLGSPVWLALLIAAFAVVVSVYVSLWSVVISLWATQVSFAACFISGLVSGAVCAVYAHPLTGIALMGASLVCGGLAIFAFFGCKALTLSFVRFTKKSAVWIKKLFTGKEMA